MRRILKYALVLIIVFILIVFNIKDHKVDVKSLTRSTYTVDDHDDIKMSLISIKGTTINLSIEYSSEAEGIYGEFYAIELKHDDIWYSLPHDQNVLFTAVGHTLQQGQIDQWSIDYSHLYGSLPIGEYRIIKSIQIGDHEYFMSAEFSIFSE